ncbi:DUF3105 domain-containing protein [Micromonospora purpureochromogenes]|uniref:DUF3105 domain-containing protein n=1 Tax=Micromonospora purpureochromogenes TaxID=47872 RepID=UPI0033CF5715
MSISTPGGPERRPTVVSTGNKPAAGRPASGAKPGAGKSAGSPRPTSGGKGPRKPIAPVKVSQGRSWGPIALFVAVGVLAAAIIGYGAYAAFQGSKPWEKRAADIDGIVDFRKKDPKMVQGGQHQQGAIKYDVLPPIGGPHNATWQRCLGDVYEAPIASEHAVHSLEHGAVWVTYRPGLPQADVDKLASLVKGKDFVLMSPFEGLDKPISLQAWGYQLKVDKADDPRVEEFIKTLAQNASAEPGVPCSSGNYTTGTGTTPRDMQASMGG